MRVPLIFALLALPLSPARGYDDDLKVQRKLGKLYLGDSIKDVKRIYKPSQDWPSYVEPRGRVNRIRVERSYLKTPDPRIETMWLGVKRGSLVEIQYIYDARATKAQPVEALAADWAVIYGEPRLTNGRYWWDDGKTVLRIFYAEVPVLKGSGQAVELRTSVQIMDSGLFERVD